MSSLVSQVEAAVTETAPAQPDMQSVMVKNFGILAAMGAILVAARGGVEMPTMS